MPLQKIPLSFEYQGKYYKATLEETRVTNNPTHWHLMINRYYCGQMVLSQGTFRFTSQTGRFQELNDFFVDVLIAWYE